MQLQQDKSKEPQNLLFAGTKAVSRVLSDIQIGLIITIYIPAVNAIETSHSSLFMNANFQTKYMEVTLPILKN
jgi:hypothetical protein